MKARIALGILFCSAITLPLAYSFANPLEQAAAAQPPAVVAWEHLAMSQDGSSLDAKLSKQINKVGSEGWQLVCVTPITENGWTVKTIYYFRRPKQ